MPAWPIPVESVSTNNACCPLVATTASNVAPPVSEIVAVQSSATLYVPTDVATVPPFVVEFTPTMLPAPSK
jgi:hypothetical protein